MSIAVRRMHVRAAGKLVQTGAALALHEELGGVRGVRALAVAHEVHQLSSHRLKQPSPSAQEATSPPQDGASRAAHTQPTSPGTHVRLTPRRPTVTYFDGARRKAAVQR